jgi:hypothetical protein
MLPGAIPRQADSEAKLGSKVLPNSEVCIMAFIMKSKYVPRIADNVPSLLGYRRDDGVYIVPLGCLRE